MSTVLLQWGGGNISSNFDRGELSHSSSLSISKGRKKSSKSAKIVKLRREPGDGILSKLERGHFIAMVVAIIIIIFSLVGGYFVFFGSKPKNDTEDKIWKEAEKSTEKQTEILKMLIKKKGEKKENGRGEK